MKGEEIVLPTCVHSDVAKSMARYLKDRSVEVCGVDLSAAMVQHTSQRNPNIPIHKGDMRALDFPPASFAGMVAFYSLIHLQRPEVPQVLRELHRVLRALAPLLLAFHGGTGEVHTEHWFRQGVSIDATLFTAEEMMGYLHQAGFQVAQVSERDPYAFEYQSRRVYILGSKG
jgi:ubiquinone/menaquinone biosynthesis C-methylase UbiE